MRETSRISLEHRGLLNRSGKFILPDYGGHSIANIAATFLKIFGVQSDEQFILPNIQDERVYQIAEGKHKVMVILLDGLGYNQLLKVIDSKSLRIFKELSEKGLMMPLTSTFPSTTATAIPSFWTGTPPAAHMILGYQIFLKEFDVIANMLKLSPRSVQQSNVLKDWGLDTQSFVPVKCVSEDLTKSGVKVRILMGSYVIESALSSIVHRGVGFKNGTRVFSDIWVTLRQVVAESAKSPELAVAYWEGIDSVAHHYGPMSDQWHTEIEMIAYLIENQIIKQMPKSLKSKTMLVITSDHGQIYSPKDNVFEIKQTPELVDLLLMKPTGEVRHRYFHAISGFEDELFERLEEKFSDYDIKFVRSEDALKMGFYGEPFDYAEVRRRLGDIIGISFGPFGISWDKDQGDLIGRHGGATADEMFVPFIVVGLDEF